MSKSIPQLPAITDTQTTDLYHVVRASVDRQQTFEDLRSGVMSFSTKTIFVDSAYGSDLTGEVENPAKPFATIVAATTAGQAAFTGATAPSATEPVLMKINGYFTEDIGLVDYYNYDLGHSVVTGVLADNGVDATCIVYGQGTIGSIGISIYAIDLTGSNSNLTVHAKQIYGDMLVTNSCFLYIYNTILTQTNGMQFEIYGGTTRVYSCYMVNTSTHASLYGNCQVGGAGYIEFYSCTMYSAKSCIETINTATTTGQVVLNDCYLKTTGTNFDCINITTSAGTSLSCTIKDSTLIANGTGNSIDAAQATNVKIYGRCQTNLTHDTGNVTLQVGTVANNGFIIDTNVV